MLRAQRSALGSAFIPLIFAVLMVFAFSCGEKPAESTLDKETPFNGSGSIDPGTGGSFLLGSVPDSGAASGRIEVWAMNVAFDDTTGIVSFDARLLNSTQRVITAPIRFVITSVRPADIAVVDFDGVTADQRPFYDFSDMLGDDNMLAPGESSGPVAMKFHTVTARSFALGFRVDLGPAPGTGIIGGVVFRDDNQNGERERCDRCEPGIEGITVVLQHGDDEPNAVSIVRTNENGEYAFRGLREGVYTVTVIVRPTEWKVTSTNPLLVTLIKDADGNVQSFYGAYFGLYPVNVPGPEQTLFGPIMIGPFTPYGTELDSTFVNPPSPMTVVFHYYLEVAAPVNTDPMPGVVDSAKAWINGVLVFEYGKTIPPDTAYFPSQVVELRPGFVRDGLNEIRLRTTGDEGAAVMWRVYKTPMVR